MPAPAPPGSPALKVILLTGMRGEETRAAGEHAGACAFLTKPFSPLELIERVEGPAEGA
ncbi:MAG: hypothetical protein KIT58_04690 [Planctomycetota bacterium]|nr:hypothetical protein [Planctomycetota bacterium]